MAIFKFANCKRLPGRVPKLPRSMGYQLDQLIGAKFVGNGWVADPLANGRNFIIPATPSNPSSNPTNLAPVSQGKYGETMEKMLDMYGHVWTCPKMDGL